MGKARTPPCAEWPEWSEAKKWGYIRSKLRAAWLRWPPRFAVLAAAKRAYKGDKKQQKWEFKCAICGLYHPAKEIEVDHIEPAGTLRSYEDLAGFVERLLVGVDKLRCLCKSCHRLITKQQKESND